MQDARLMGSVGCFENFLALHIMVSLISLVCIEDHWLTQLMTAQLV